MRTEPELSRRPLSGLWPAFGLLLDGPSSRRGCRPLARSGRRPWEASRRPLATTTGRGPAARGTGPVPPGARASCGRTPVALRDAGIAVSQRDEDVRCRETRATQGGQGIVDCLEQSWHAGGSRRIGGVIVEALCSRTDGVGVSESARWIVHARHPALRRRVSRWGQDCTPRGYRVRYRHGIREA